MRVPAILRLLNSGSRFIKSGTAALVLLVALNLGPLDAAAVALPESATKSVISPATATIGGASYPANTDQRCTIVANATSPARSLTLIPQISVFFPIIGLVVALSLTQLLRRRKISQHRSGSPNGR
jgi:hypothetical protein